MPDGWGWNLATIVAVGSAATVLTLMGLLTSLVFSVRSSSAAIRQATLAAREHELRIRPWLNLKHGAFETGPSRIKFTAQIGNHGLTPALSSVIALEFWTSESGVCSVGEIEAAIIYPDTSFEAVFNYQPDDDFARQYSSEKKLGFRVSITYASGGAPLVTVAEGEFRPDDALMKFTMRITQAT